MKRKRKGTKECTKLKKNVKPLRSCAENRENERKNSDNDEGESEEPRK